MTNYQVSPYEQARLDKIKRNNERLASLGLLDAKKRVRASVARKQPQPPSTPKRTLRKTRAAATSAVTPSPARSSRRLKRKPVQFEPLLDDDESIRIVRKKFKEVKRKTKTNTSGFKCDIPNVSSSPLTVKEKAVIGKKMEGDFLEKFEDYVTNVDTLSDQNRRNVLRQITKLATGEGIRYESKAYGWPDDCYFIKGTKVGPTDDILKLMDIGRECEDEWGRDHGNGWLLSHPLKKLYMFQQYHLQD
mmetsp:Transcript_10545/g.23367  ORF Transcript_10545/g.23367 Transcript_10545/m.23367 type:complete len:247 (+) Transcript_10545:132-872(+)|eukprot:CAMPEP_0172306764 /NCGR_PEP_ID=MMETSP1058-20130122/7766_1 /TAXON_ID=83371 /ORGANISM="Detonula confervacea, Strain CCMP 353" /LENGTH=246 /DNA_ID=CAMNT_0013018747 /DNA_START=125 /DNA_END=865 /DNA_ORIENTATION=+